MNCSKCGNEAQCKKVGLNDVFTVCHECYKLHRQMTEKLRMEYVDKLREVEDFFFNSAKPIEESSMVISSTFVDNEELYEDVKTPEPEPVTEFISDSQELPQELFG